MSTNTAHEIVPRDAALDVIGISLISFGITQPDLPTKALLMAVGVVLIVVKYGLRIR